MQKHFLDRQTFVFQNGTLKTYKRNTSYSHWLLQSIQIEGQFHLHRF